MRSMYDVRHAMYVELTPMRKLTHPENVARQEIQRRKLRLPLTIVLNNIRSLHNVGAIFRTADGVGAEKIWLCGITGYPPNSMIAKTALGAEDSVPWDHAQDASSVLRELKAAGYEIVLLEQMESSIDYAEWKPARPVALVIGNEIEGVSPELLSLCDAAVEIEMMGVKNSLNAAVAFGIIAYHIRSVMKEKTGTYV